MLKSLIRGSLGLLKWALCGVGVLALGVLHLRGKGSGVEMEQPVGNVWEIRDGKAVSMDFYGSHADALEAVGLQ